MEQPENFKDLSQITGYFLNKEESLTGAENLALMKQVHGSTVLVIDKAPDPENPPMADGFITQTPGLKLAVKTADCIPLLIADPLQKTVGAFHVGWKPGLLGIVESAILTFQKLGSQPQHLVAALGPALGKPSFPVSKEMMQLYPEPERIFFEQKEEGIFFDNTAYIIYRLKRAGIQNIWASSTNTYRDLTYHSFRRENGAKGRQYSIIFLNT